MKLDIWYAPLVSFSSLIPRLIQEAHKISDSHDDATGMVPWGGCRGVRDGQARGAVLESEHSARSRQNTIGEAGVRAGDAREQRGSESGMSGTR